MRNGYVFTEKSKDKTSKRKERTNKETDKRNVHVCNKEEMAALEQVLVTDHSAFVVIPPLILSVERCPTLIIFR